MQKKKEKKNRLQITAVAWNADDWWEMGMESISPESHWEESKIWELPPESVLGRVK